MAHPGSGPHRAALFVQRHGAGVTAAIAIAVSLVAAIVITTVSTARLSSDTQTAVCTWNLECGHVSIPAAKSST